VFALPGCPLFQGPGPRTGVPPQGLEAWDQVKRQGYEGLVAKDESSAYRGVCMLSWIRTTSRGARLVAFGPLTDAVVLWCSGTACDSRETISSSRPG
jgi:hypothetical protein